MHNYALERATNCFNAAMRRAKSHARHARAMQRPARVALRGAETTQRALNRAPAQLVQKLHDDA
eukprot:11105707-Lingulodinium_polyedra.AAC.1